jgi:hypothetical protein
MEVFSQAPEGPVSRAFPTGRPPNLARCACYAVRERQPSWYDSRALAA